MALTAPDAAAPYIVGAGIASAGWSTALLAVQTTGTSRFLLGANGEVWTSEALRRLRRRGWCLVEAVPLDFGDIDHVLIGPGGAYAIETKATQHAWDLDHPDDRLIRAALQSRKSARRLSGLLLERDIRVRTSVRPVLVIWGPARGTATMIDGVEVLRGTDLRAWRDGLHGEVLTEEEVSRAGRGLNQMVQVRDAAARTRDAQPFLVEHGPFELVERAAAVLVGMSVAAIAVAAAAEQWTGGALAVVLVATTIGGVAAARITRLHLPAIGWAAVTIAGTGAHLVDLAGWI